MQAIKHAAYFLNTENDDDDKLWPMDGDNQKWVPQIKSGRVN